MSKKRKSGQKVLCGSYDYLYIVQKELSIDIYLTGFYIEFGNLIIIGAEKLSYFEIYIYKQKNLIISHLPPNFVSVSFPILFLLNLMCLLHMNKCTYSAMTKLKIKK